MDSILIFFIILAVEDYRLDLLGIVLMCVIFFALHWLFGRYVWSSDQPDFNKDAIFEEAKEKICPKGKAIR